MQVSRVFKNDTITNLCRMLQLPGINRRSLVIAGLSLLVIYITNLYSFLLFHVIIEIFSVIVAFAIFMFAWNSRTHIHNSGLTLLGTAYLTIGALDLLHACSYEGMGVFQAYGADTATQLWIAARYLESITLAVAPLLTTRTISMGRTFPIYAAYFILVVVTIFFWPVFPTCYVKGVGLTPFKKASEYLIAVILLAALTGLIQRRRNFDDQVFKLLAVSIVLTIISEVMFTFYISVYGVSNIVGHFFKLASFWLIYKAIIETGMQQPFRLLFRELTQSEQRFRDLVDTLPTGVCEFNADNRLSYINPAGRAIIGYDEQDLRGSVGLERFMDPESQKKKLQRLSEIGRGSAVGSTEYSLRRKDGSMAEVIVNSMPIYREGRLSSIQTSMIDVTELNRLKNDLQQAHKMESIAMLASGMAHRINNMLMGVVGRLELLKLNAITSNVKEGDFKEVLAGCERIAGLIKHLLAYSRGGRYQSQTIDLNQFIEQHLAELRAGIPPGIQFIYIPAAGLPAISADPRQLLMIISEVANNAVEAMDKTGRITMTLAFRRMDADQTEHILGMRAGNYVHLQIRDTGMGMEAEVLARIFEPFYSTKFTGRGLGMAAVYGIVKNHGGWIGVDSKPGSGTMVQIYLPVDGAAPETPPAP